MLGPSPRNLGVGEGGVPDPSGQVYEYDEENRLTAVRRASDNALLLSIAYDAVGRRVWSADCLAAGDPCGGPPGGTGVSPVVTRHIYAALETLEEHLSCDGGTNYALAREFVWGDRFPQPVALIIHGGVSGGFGGSAVPPGESIYHYLHDVLGSVVALTNANGQVVERYTYDPYGKTIIEQTNPATGLPTARLEASAFGNPFAWTGQRYDVGVGLYQFLVRTFSPSLGRWLTRDPAGYVDGLNLYGYAHSSPLVHVDPLGLDDGSQTHGQGDGWRVDSEVFNSSDAERANGNVHIQMDGHEKIYYDPVNDTFTYEGGRPISKSLEKQIRGDPKIMKALEKGVTRVKSQARGRFSLGKGRGTVILTSLGWFALDIMFGYLELGNCPYFKQFLDAIRRGDLNEADRLHDEVRDWLIDHNMEKAGLDFDWRWVNEWLPELSKKQQEQEREKNAQKGKCP